MEKNEDSDLLELQELALRHKESKKQKTLEEKLMIVKAQPKMGWYSGTMVHFDFSKMEQDVPEPHPHEPAKERLIFILVLYLYYIYIIIYII